ncbi:MAG: ABC transporter permease, partial [Burkholderiales bacterium]
MRAHLEMRTQHNIAAGMPAEEARYAALRQFGWMASIKDTCRDQRGVNWPENLGQDMRYAARMLRKNPGFTAVAVLTLALGIGVNTAAFSVLNALLLHSVPYPRPHELVRVFRTTPNTQRGVHAHGNLLDYRAKNTVFEHLAIVRHTSFNLAVPGQPADRLRGMLVTPDFFPLLGVQPALGRVFTDGELQPGADAVVVLSHDVWMAGYGGDSSLVGREIRIDGAPVTVIGIMPA